MKLHALLDEGLVLPRLRARDKEGALREMAERLEPRLPAGFAGTLADRLLRREALGTTAIGHGVAVPHCRAKGLEAPALLLALSREGVPFEAGDGEPSRVFFLLISPEDNPGAGLRLLASISALTRTSKALASKLLKAGTGAGVLEALRAEEERSRG